MTSTWTSSAPQEASSRTGLLGGGFDLVALLSSLAALLALGFLVSFGLGVGVVVVLSSFLASHGCLVF